jgi:homoserine kinase
MVDFLTIDRGPLIIRAFAPATIANVGPGFDVMGLAINEPGDIVEVWVEPPTRGQVQLEQIVGGAVFDAGKPNVVTAVSNYLLKGGLTNYSSFFGGFAIKAVLYKNMPIGSGMGSSAASGAATVKAINELARIFSGSIDEFTVREALLHGEKVADGSPHPDNTIPSYYGGAHIFHHSKGMVVSQKFTPTDDIYFVVCSLPDVRSDTLEMRAKLVL